MDKGLTVQGIGLTDVGKARSANEDAFFCGQVAAGRFTLGLVVDGCGGYRGGAQCAAITRQCMLDYINNHTEDDASSILKKAMVYANNQAHEARLSDTQLNRMCCVATAVLINHSESMMYLAHVGDTRLYACTSGRIIKLSHDHSPVGRDEEEGRLTEIEAMNDPDRNIIERAIALKPLQDDTPYIETATFPITGGLTYMLCSDGLSDMITSAEMTDILSSTESLEVKAQQLIGAANNAGGKDNITIVLIQTDGEGEKVPTAIMDYYATKLNPARRPDYSNVLQNTYLSTLQPEEGEDIIEVDLPLQDAATTSTAPPTHRSVILNEVKNPSNSAAESVRMDSPLERGRSVSENTAQPKRKFKKKKIFKTYILPPLITILLTASVVWGIFAYRAHRLQLIEEQNEAIRQEIFIRNLYYNYKPLSSPIEEQ